MATAASAHDSLLHSLLTAVLSQPCRRYSMLLGGAMQRRVAGTYARLASTAHRRDLPPWAGVRPSLGRSRRSRRRLRVGRRGRPCAMLLRHRAHAQQRHAAAAAAAPPPADDKLFNCPATAAVLLWAGPGMKSAGSNPAASTTMATAAAVCARRRRRSAASGGVGRRW